jgi:hypothetical protein
MIKKIKEKIENWNWERKEKKENIEFLKSQLTFKNILEESYEVLKELEEEISDKKYILGYGTEKRKSIPMKYISLTYEDRFTGKARTDKFYFKYKILTNLDKPEVIIDYEYILKDRMDLKLEDKFSGKLDDEYYLRSRILQWLSKILNWTIHGNSFEEYEYTFKGIWDKLESKKLGQRHGRADKKEGKDFSPKRENILYHSEYYNAYSKAYERN